MDDPKAFREKLIADLSSPIIEALNRHGITTEYLAKKLKEELEALETKEFCYKGTVVSSKGKAALEIRQRARMDAHKLLNHYPKISDSLDGELIFRPTKYTIEPQQVEKKDDEVK